MGFRKNGVYKIWPPGFTTSIEVFCAMSIGQGAIVMQRRDESEMLDFNREWHEYKAGFGSPYSSVWIGLENMYLLAGAGKGAILNVELIHRNDTETRLRAIYNIFEIASEADNYSITARQCKGDACDALAYQNGAGFSTRDNDNDSSQMNCAQEYTGGWWFNDCKEPHLTNLNGLFQDKNGTESKKAIRWGSWQDDKGNITFSVMKLRIPQRWTVSNMNIFKYWWKLHWELFFNYRVSQKRRQAFEKILLPFLSRQL